ncbi:MAG: putative sulfate exporter family transporter, partial [Candidatus Bathyarchaeota archaeon]
QLRGRIEGFAENVPGLVFAMVIAFISFLVWSAYKPVSTLMWSFIIGIVISNTTNITEKLKPGLRYASSQLLKLTIAVLGLVTSASVWLEVGLGVVNALVIIVFSYAASILLGKRLGLSSRLAILIGVGTSICGASAIAATAPAINAKEEEIGVALSGITLFGLISMFLYPYLFSNTVVNQWLLGSPTVYAVWVGSGVHESAQVIAAAIALDASCMQPAMIIKSIRIFMIAPVVLASTFYLSRAEGTNGAKAKVTIPLFAVAFLVNSLLCAALDASSFTFLGIGWNLAKTALKSSLIPFLLAISFAGVGTKVQFKDIASVGWKPFVFAAAMAIVAGTLALAMAVVTAPYLA